MMRRELIIAPELLTDERLDALEKLAASMIDATDSGAGSELTNDEMALTLGASVSKIKQCIGKLITVGLTRHEMQTGNRRVLHSQLLIYRAMRRAELGWGEESPLATPAAPTPPDTPASASPLPSPLPVPPPPHNGNGAEAVTAGDLFGETLIPVDASAGPTNAEIYAEYPRKVERQEALREIEKARYRLAAELRRAGEREPIKKAGEKLLERTREFGRLWRERLASFPNDRGVIKHPGGWYKNDRWNDENYADWSVTIAARIPNSRNDARAARGPAGFSRPGQFPESDNGDSTGYY